MVAGPRNQNLFSFKTFHEPCNHPNCSISLGVPKFRLKPKLDRSTLWVTSDLPVARPERRIAAAVQSDSRRSKKCGSGIGP
jgi:hypothetical protein